LAGWRQPLRRSAELVELLYEAVPAASRRTGGHPAKRTFQALRIEVNGELAALDARIGPGDQDHQM
jgi:16S rRNA (cytosine1402-N4)-methyltransferase